MSEVIKDYLEYKDGQVIWKKSKGSRRAAGDRFGCFDGRYWHGMFNGKMYREHQLVWLLHHDSLPSCIDHVDGNPLNNKIENLRQVSFSENSMNAKIRKDNKTGCKNVMFDKARNKYKVEITHNKKKIALGRFDDLEFACLVADEARDKYHGKFARSI